MFLGFEIVPAIIFLCVIGIAFTRIIRGILTWNRNNHSPHFTVGATVVSKRMYIAHHHQIGSTTDMRGIQGIHTSSSTQYYITFQTEHGDRIEFKVRKGEYGVLVERDYGELSYRGNHYLKFLRKN